jgi:maltooligosyltrehalose trehalohydrolase
VAAALVLTSPFIPLLFQGEEWGTSSPFLYFTAHEDTELGQAVRAGRQREFAAFGWAPEDIPDPQARETFACSTLDWHERDHAPHADLLDWHRRLLQLRRQMPVLTDGRMDHVKVRFDEDARWLVVERGLVTVGCNLATQPQCVPLQPGRPAHLLLASDARIEVHAESLTLPPDTIAILGPAEDR